MINDTIIPYLICLVMVKKKKKTVLHIFRSRFSSAGSDVIRAVTSLLNMAAHFLPKVVLKGLGLATIPK